MSYIDDNTLGALSEQLCRIEHKLDLILTNQATSLPEALNYSLGTEYHACPSCLQKVTYQPDFFKKIVRRDCGCHTGQNPSAGMQFDPNAVPVPTTKGPTNDE